MRIVWRFQAADESRTFSLRYGIRGLAVAYDDVVDVNLKVWGDEWEQPLGQLTATMTGPANVVRAWGHPVWVRGDVTLEGERSLLRAVAVPARQFVELRTLYPRDAFPSTAGMRRRRGRRAGEDHRRGAGGRGRLRARPRTDPGCAPPPVADRTRPPWRSGRCRRSSWPASSSGASGARCAPATTGSTSRSRRRRPSRRSCRCCSGRAATPARSSSPRRCSTSCAAASIDPPRRRRSAQIWGGLRTELVNDLELTAGDQTQPLTPWERDVADVVDSVLDGGSERLSRFREEIEDERAEMSERFTAFKDNVEAEVGSRALVRLSGRDPALGRPGRVRRAGRAARVSRDRRLALRVPALGRRRPARPRHLRVPQRGDAGGRADPAEALAAPTRARRRPRRSAGRRFAAT